MEPAGSSAVVRLEVRGQQQRVLSHEAADTGGPPLEFVRHPGQELRTTRLPTALQVERQVMHRRQQEVPPRGRQRRIERRRQRRLDPGTVRQPTVLRSVGRPLDVVRLLREHDPAGQRRPLQPAERRQPVE
ncbi:MAG: hypothetical protein F4Z19_16330 [Holophagales bacterium]|nr:hypothetical protein [Holophagales bacterium]